MLKSCSDFPPGAYVKVAFGSELITKVTTGRITADEWRMESARRLREVQPELDTDEFIRLWNAAPVRGG